jgi:hypothetical protein
LRSQGQEEGVCMGCLCLLGEGRGKGGQAQLGSRQCCKQQHGAIAECTERCYSTSLYTQLWLHVAVAPLDREGSVLWVLLPLTLVCAFSVSAVSCCMLPMLKLTALTLRSITQNRLEPGVVFLAFQCRICPAAGTPWYPMLEVAMHLAPRRCCHHASDHHPPSTPPGPV